MANELSITLSIFDNLVQQAIGLVSIFQSQVAAAPRTTGDFKMSVTTSEIAIPLGALTGATLGWSVWINLDSTNSIDLRIGTGAAKFATLPPGAGALFKIGPGITAPYAIAYGSACLLRAQIWEA